ncbi:hypothetical protein J4E85_011533 [Alternaria conjuncta]|uniref:uncharacterized protein n=1 Tax=Alternaria conjuncta TaxID=181017 RepID=UPI00221F5205|nr:uncharacterized protein J4E85_011533 [Alternaria conjuncta]KAI4909856.1 hypothetical protein J4E85_011533 [Alternaria conjuncta]
MKLSLIIMAAASTLVLAGGGGKPEKSWLCKKCDIYRLEHCQKDVCKDKLDGGKFQGPKWRDCMDDCDYSDTCKYVPPGETVTCGHELCVESVPCVIPHAGSS